MIDRKCLHIEGWVVEVFGIAVVCGELVHGVESEGRPTPSLLKMTLPSFSSADFPSGCKYGLLPLRKDLRMDEDLGLRVDAQPVQLHPGIILPL